MAYIKALIVSAIVAFAIVFMIQNIEALSHPLALRLDFYVVKMQTTPYATYIVLILSFFAGLLIASALGVAERMKLKKQLRASKKEEKRLNKELDSLRNLPITNQEMGQENGGEPEPEKEETT